MRNNYGKHGIGKLGMLLSSILILLVFTVNAQVSTSYSFSQSAGTYNPITGGTVVVASGSTPSSDNVNYPNQNIGFNFTFNGSTYTTFGINSNGFIWFGTGTPSTSTYTPISTTGNLGGTGTIDGVVSALGFNLLKRTSVPYGELRVETIGTAPNQTCVIQFMNWRGFGIGTSTVFNFQIRLNETSNTIELVYGSFTGGTNTTTFQVGLRGIDNTDFNNVSADAANWAGATQGAVNNEGSTISTTIYPASGTTFTWTPLPPCTGTPTAGAITGVSSVCSGAGTTLMLSGATTGTGISYQWASSTTAGGPYTNMGTSTTQATGNLTATTYYVVTVTCANSALSATTTEYAVAVNALPTVTVTPNSGTVCSGGGSPLSLTASGADTYTWSPATGLTPSTGATVSADPSVTTTYTVTGTDLNGCQATATASVQVAASPSITSVTASPSAICVGGNTQLDAVVATTPAAQYYQFSASTGATLDPMVGATTVLTSGNDDTPTSAPAPIGFTFNFNGTSYTQYSISPDGWILLGGATAVNQFTNSVTSTTNVPKIYPFWDDIATGADGNVQTVVVGTAPNRIFIAQWFVTIPRNTTGPANSTFQAWLYEGTNNIEFRYGAMGPQPGGSSSIGITAGSTNYQSVTLSTNTASASAANNANTGVPASGTMYTFAVPANTYSWSPAATLNNSTILNPVASNVTSTTTYTLTVTNGTCSSTGTVTVTATATTPSAPTATNSTQCGVAIPTASVSGAGTGETYNWYTVSTGGTPVQTGSSNTYNTAISSTTTFYVAIDNGTCEGPRTAVTVTVTQPDAITASISATTVCPSTAITLDVTKAAGPNTYTYSWSASPSAGSGMPSSVSGSNQVITPTASGTYSYIVTAVDAACTAMDTVTVTVNPLPNIYSATATPSTVCSGTPVNLLALTQVSTSPASVTIGTADINDITGGPYREGACAGNKAQYLFTASELTSAGLSAGNITSIGFTVAFIGSGGTMNNYTISMAATSATTLTTNFDNSPATTVYGPVGYVAVSGLNTHTFTTPFFWDGISNVVVTICHDNLCTGSSTVAMTNAPGKTLYTYSGATTSCNLTTGSSYTYRPVITFGSSPYGAGSYTWTWNPGNMSGNSVTTTPTNATASPVVQTYTVTAVDPATTCSNTATVNVTVNPIPAAPAVTNSTQCGAGIPAASATGTGTILWYSAATGGTPIQTGGTTYADTITTTTTFYVEINDGSCTSPRVAVTATVNPAPAITVTSSTGSSVCSGSSTTLTVTSGNAGYAYTWSPATGLSATTGATVTATPTVATTYTVTANDAVSGCVIWQSLPLSITQSPVVTATAASSTVCSGSTVQLDVTNTTPPAIVTVGTGTLVNDQYSYPAPYGNWYWGARQQFLITAAELTAAGLSAGPINSLAFDVTALNGSAAHTNFTISMGNTSATSLTTAFQTGLTQVYTTASYAAVVGWNTHTFSTPFVWNGTDNVVVETCFNNSSYTFNVSVRQSATAYSSSIVYNSDASGVCANTFVNVNFNQRPNMRFGIPSTFTYAWSPAATLSNAAISNPVATPTTTTTYTATVTYDQNGCVTTTSVAVNTNPLPTVTAAAAASTICEGASTTLTASGADTYAWSPATGLSATTGATVTANPTVTTTYTVSGTDLNGCVNTAPVTLTINPLPVVTLAAMSDLCEDASAITITGESPTGGTFSGTGVTGNMFDPAVAGVGTHDIIYSYTDGNSCTNSDTASITVNALPVVTLAAFTDECINNAAITLTGESPAGGTFSGTGVSGGMFDPAVAGVGTHTITYNYTDANGCSSSAASSITVNAPPVVTLAAISPVCESGAAITLGGESPAGGVFSGTGVSGGMFDPTVAGAGMHNIIYTYTDPATTCSNSDTATVQVYAAPVVTLAAQSDVCANGAAFTITGESPAGGMFSGTGVSGNMFDPMVAGAGMHDIIYTYTDTNMCSNSDTATVMVNAVPAITLASYSPVCEGAAMISLMGESPAGGTYSGTGVSGSMFDPVVAGPGTHYVVYSYTDTNSCTGMDSAAIVVNANPVVNLGSDVIQCGGTVTLNAGNPGSMYAWSTNDSLQMITVSATGSYAVMVTDTNSCSASDTVNVTINAPAFVDLGADTAICNTATVTLDAGAGYTYLWSTNATTQTITVSTSGTYTVTVTNSDGCQDSDAITVTVNNCDGIAENGNGYVMSVRPNPSEGVFNLVINGAEIEKLNVEILDIQGKLVYGFAENNISGDFTKEINLGGLAKGVYYLRMNTGATIVTEKLVIQ